IPSGERVARRTLRTTEPAMERASSMLDAAAAPCLSPARVRYPPSSWPSSCLYVGADVHSEPTFNVPVPLLAAAFLVFSLAACGSSSNDVGDDSSGTGGQGLIGAGGSGNTTGSGGMGSGSSGSNAMGGSVSSGGSNGGSANNGGAGGVGG